MNARDIPVGIISGMPASEYHAMPGFLSNTGLSWLARSPEIFYARALDPNRPPEKERAGQLEGTLAHCAILEPAEFGKRYRVGPDVSSRSVKAWKEAEEVATADGLQLIKPEQYDTAMRQAESVRRLPDIAELLSAGEPEVSAFWRDTATDVLCKCRPDWTHPAGDSAILVDVKTYSDASPGEFARQIARKGYYRQAAWYSRGYTVASGRPVLAFVFLAVETEYPFAASAVMLDDAALEQGARECARLTELYARCLERQEWPGYSRAIELVSLPRYLLDQPEGD